MKDQEDFESIWGPDTGGGAGPNVWAHEDQRKFEADGGWAAFRRRNGTSYSPEIEAQLEADGR